MTVTDGALIITIGLDSLAFAGGHHPDFWDGEAATADGPYIHVTDELVFAREVARALEAESEDGSTILTRAIDVAVKQAVEDGCEGVDYDK